MLTLHFTLRGIFVFLNFKFRLNLTSIPSYYFTVRAPNRLLHRDPQSLDKQLTSSYKFQIEKNPIRHIHSYSAICFCVNASYSEFNLN